MSNLSDFLTENSITSQQLIDCSHALETLDIEQRANMVKRAAARRTKKTYADLEAPKPAASGRGVSDRTLRDALAGQPVPRLGRKKILRAVNAMLTSAKKDAVEWRAIFTDVPAKKGKKKK